MPLPANKERLHAAWQEEDAAAEQAEAKQAELRKLSKELFGSGHPPGGDGRKKGPQKKVKRHETQNFGRPEAQAGSGCTRASSCLLGDTPACAPPRVPQNASSAARGTIIVLRGHWKLFSFALDPKEQLDKRAGHFKEYLAAASSSGCAGARLTGSPGRSTPASRKPTLTGTQGRLRPG